MLSVSVSLSLLSRCSFSIKRQTLDVNQACGKDTNILRRHRFDSPIKRRDNEKVKVGINVTKDLIKDKQTYRDAKSVGSFDTVTCEFDFHLLGFELLMEAVLTNKILL